MNAEGNRTKYNLSPITVTLRALIEPHTVGMLYDLITGTLLIGILSYLTHNDKLVKLPHI